MLPDVNFPETVFDNYKLKKINTEHTLLKDLEYTAGGKIPTQIKLNVHGCNTTLMRKITIFLN